MHAATKCLFPVNGSSFSHPFSTSHYSYYSDVSTVLELACCCLERQLSAQDHHKIATVDERGVGARSKMAQHGAWGMGHGACSQNGHDDMPMRMPFCDMAYIWSLAVDSIHRTIVRMIILT